MENTNKPANIDEYIAEHAPEIQSRLQAIRAAIKAKAPQATECINYGIPTFQLHGNLVHFAGYQHHIGFYPGAQAMIDFESQFSNYKRAKGSVQFPHTLPLPLDLVQEVVHQRVQANELKQSLKKVKSKR